ncbi:hypothetical protein E8A74_31095 [Polyangium fumosum]|uniref:Uncharacterized protein n=1 Tax=Polyangium fumosum TaxID=889272 RepID=A0A4U1J357_9BACT|nr:hypothetical protein E8A74_31095 [Polyangium fumosum]
MADWQIEHCTCLAAGSPNSARSKSSWADASGAAGASGAVGAASASVAAGGASGSAGLVSSVAWLIPRSPSAGVERHGRAKSIMPRRGAEEGDRSWCLRGEDDRSQGEWIW